MARSWSRRALAPAALLLGLGLVGLGCGGGGSDADGGSGYEEPAGPPVETLALDSGNLYFDPDTLEAPPGILEFRLTNVESGAHTLVLRGIPGFELEVNGDGDKDSGKVEVDAGQYEFYCTIPGHAEAGMKGTLTVE